MRRLQNIQIKESISRGKLIFRETWYEKAQRIQVYFISFVLVYLSITSLSSIDTTSQNDLAIGGTFFTLAGLVGLILFYRNVNEKKLMKVHSKFNAAETKEKLLEFAHQEAFQVYRKSGYCLILNETGDDFSGYFTKSRVIFIRDYVVYFAVIQDNPKLNRPVLTTHLFLKHALRKLLN